MRTSQGEISVSAALPRIVAALVVGVIAIFPAYWLVVTAFTPARELFGPPNFLPDFSHTGGVEYVFNHAPFARWIWNSVRIAGAAVVLCLTIGFFAAYSLSRLKFRGKTAFGFALFATQMLPPALIVIPLYALFLRWGLLGSLTGLVLANSAFILPIVIWILKAAIDAVPAELEEAATVDGASMPSIQLGIVLPLIRPSVAAAAVLAFFFTWNEYLFAVSFIRDRNSWPATVGLASFIGELVTPLDAVMAGGLLFAAPAVIFFLRMQRQIASGLTAGAVKG